MPCVGCEKECKCTKEKCSEDCNCKQTSECGCRTATTNDEAAAKNVGVCKKAEAAVGCCKKATGNSCAEGEKK